MPNLNASPFKGGDTPKLRETPKASGTKPVYESSGGQVNCLGYGHNSEDTTMDNPQPSSYVLTEYGEGSETK